MRMIKSVTHSPCPFGPSHGKTGCRYVAKSFMRPESLTPGLFCRGLRPAPRATDLDARRAEQLVA